MSHYYWDRRGLGFGGNISPNTDLIAGKLYSLGNAEPVVYNITKSQIVFVADFWDYRPFFEAVLLYTGEIIVEPMPGAGYKKNDAGRDVRVTEIIYHGFLIEEQKIFMVEEQLKSLKRLYAEDYHELSL